MKKFLAIVFSLIFALSACTVAFADAAEWTCPEEGCKAVLSSKALYEAHINGGCLVKFTDCEHCKARVDRANIDAHIANCPKYSSACEYCGEKFDSKAKEDAHECKVVEFAGGNETVAGVIAKAVDALKNVDWKSLADKVVDLVKGIDFQGLIAKIKPVIEKVVELVKGFAA